jgi:hypothetical protein
MGFIYFAGGSLASLSDTQNPSVAHELIWRPPCRQLAQIQIGDRLLFT